jgi:hypothetical protein
MRSMTGAIQAELDAAAVRPFFLIQGDFASGGLRFWSGIGPLTWGGFTWTGTGDLLQMSAVKESAGLVANGVTVSLSGIPSALLAVALTESFQGRALTVYFGFLNDVGAVLVDPFVLWAGRMDTMVIEEGGDTCTIAVNCESRAIAMRRARERRLTHEDQQIDAPGDMGFAFVARLQEQDFQWKLA